MVFSVEHVWFLINNHLLERVQSRMFHKVYFYLFITSLENCVTLIFELFFKKKITLSRRLWYARVGLYVTPIRFGLLSTLTANQITDSKCVSSE